MAKVSDMKGREGAGRARRAGRHAVLPFALLTLSLALSACVGSISGGGGAGTSNSVLNSSPASAALPLDQQLLQAGIAKFSAKQYPQAIEDFMAAYGLQGASSTTRYTAAYDLGVLYVQQNDIPDAIQAFKNSLKVNPTYSYALNNLAVLETSRDPQLAISLYERLLKANPADKGAVYTALGNLYAKVGNEKKGLEDLNLGSSVSAQQGQAATSPTSGT